MKDLMITNNDLIMSSYEFLNEVINPARISAGENPVKNTHFVARVEDEIDYLGAVKNFNRFGNTVRYYDLTIEQMTLVGMRESKAVRRKVLETLKRLSKENSIQLPNFNDPVESARAWADAKEAELKALDQLEAQKPMVNYYDRVSKNESHMNATQVAQKMNLTATKMNKYLDDLGVYNKSIKRGRTFNHWFIESGYGMMKQTDAGYSQAVFTTKGEQYIIEKFTSEGII